MISRAGVPDLFPLDWIVRIPMSDSLLTAEQFFAERDEFQDAGRWMELWMGRLVRLSPPDETHGLVVLNLGKLLGEHFSRTRCGSASFARPLVVARDPDTVRIPAVSCFSPSPQLDAWDDGPTEVRPDLVVDVASSNDRRRGISERVRQLHMAGVPEVWIVDTKTNQVGQYVLGEPPVVIADEGLIVGRQMLAGLSIRGASLFERPTWWGTT
jgi:Uma2 family endonuclease